MNKLVVRRLDAHVFRYPIAEPIQTSFGLMHDRPAVFVRLEDEDGYAGWGEAWCNFPSVGAEHRARLLTHILRPLVLNRHYVDPPALFNHLSHATAVLALQSGERGPFAQAVAAIDIAAWDIMAKRAGLPLWRLLGGTSPEIGVYASGLNPADADRVAAARRAEGHRAFKLKVGFGREQDRRNLERVRAVIGDLPLAVDANQAWNLAEAQAILPLLSSFAPAWIEEPLRCDRPWGEWQQLTRSTSAPLAGGENLIGREEFDVALSTGALTIIQPDIAKWGGFSGCLPVARAFLASNRRFCPHFLGAGLGLIAAGHLLAAAGGAGKLEVDANENPLRDRLAAPIMAIRDGRSRLPEEPGLGIEPDLGALESFRVAF